MVDNPFGGGVTPLFRPQVVQAAHGAASEADARLAFSLRTTYVASAALLVATLALGVGAASLDLWAPLRPAAAQTLAPAAGSGGPPAAPTGPQAAPAEGPPVASWARWPRRENE